MNGIRKVQKINLFQIEKLLVKLEVCHDLGFSKTLEKKEERILKKNNLET